MLKRLSILLLLLIVVGHTSFSQSMFAKKEFIYGKMVGKPGTLVGYFWFDNDVTQNGQEVHFKDDLNATRKKKFVSRDYDYFESDSLYMETFGAISTITGDILIMIPRIINGRIQVFDTEYKWGYMKMIKSEHFFVKKDNQKIRIKRRKFTEQMRSLIGDNPELLARVESEELQYNDLAQIIIAYNNTFAAKAD